MRSSKELSAAEYETLQKDTFYGKEKKSLAYVIGIMNMILHGVEAPNIVHTNTLNENIADIQQKDRVDVILANPPFGSSERKEVEQNFPIPSGETAYLFLQHFIKKLKTGGRCRAIEGCVCWGVKKGYVDNHPDTHLLILQSHRNL